MFRCCGLVRRRFLMMCPPSNSCQSVTLENASRLDKARFFAREEVHDLPPQLRGVHAGLHVCPDCLLIVMGVSICQLF